MSMREYRTLSESEAADIIAEIKDADIFCHVSPDGDTLGCALALRAVMEKNGAHAEIKCCDPVPESLRFLADGVNVDDKPREGVVRISVDVSSPEQLGGFSDIKDTFSLMIDHHERGGVYADNLVEPDAAACGEVIFRVVELLRDRHGFDIPVEAADYLYAAISSDTGSFRFANTTPDTHMTAARLHSMGARTVYIAHNLHAVMMKKQLFARRCGLEHMQFHCGGRLAVTYASLTDMEKGGFGASDFSEADEMRSVYGVLVGVSLRETKEGVWKASTRSSVDIDCAAVCAAFGGGGHKGAAGCTITSPTADGAIKLIADQFASAIEAYEHGKK